MSKREKQKPCGLILPPLSPLAALFGKKTHTHFARARALCPGKRYVLGYVGQTHPVYPGHIYPPHKALFFVESFYTKTTKFLPYLYKNLLYVTRLEYDSTDNPTPYTVVENGQGVEPRGEYLRHEVKIQYGNGPQLAN